MSLGQTASRTMSSETRDGPEARLIAKRSKSHRLMEGDEGRTEDLGRTTRACQELAGLGATK
eukprot:5652865-Pleurochrysis_carterae.AAC.2